MNEIDRKLLKAVKHALECHYPMMKEYPDYMDPYTYEEAKTYNDARAKIIRDFKKLVTKLCRKRRRISLRRQHFI